MKRTKTRAIFTCSFNLCFACFETEPHCVALAALELTMYQADLNSEILQPLALEYCN